MTTAEQLELFVRCVYPEGALVEVRPLPSERGGDIPGWVKRQWLPAAELPGHADELTQCNEEGRVNLYAGTLPRTHEGGGSDADCASGSCAWADFDGFTSDEALTRASALPPPTMVINSGHGVHLYWRFNGVIFPSRLSELVGDLAKMLGSDPAVKNPSRIMRLPGFWNLKDPPAMCDIVTADPTRTYDFVDLRACVPAAAAVTAPVAPADVRSAVQERARKYLVHIPGSCEGGRNTAAYRVACILRREFALGESEARSLLVEWNQKNQPPLPEKELDALLQSGARYAQKPEGCKLDAPPPRGASTPPPKRGLNIPLPFDAESELLDKFEREGRGEDYMLSLPWKRLDKLTQAGRPGTTLVVAGPAGYGKTWFLLQLLIHWRRECGASFAYLPLERNKAEWERRLLAYMCNDWALLDVTREGAEARAEAYRKYATDLPDLTCGVCENPVLPARTADGRLEVPELSPEAVIDWMERAASTHRVVAIDPLSQIEWEASGMRENRAQSAFMRKVVGLAVGSGATIVLCCHSIKRPGQSGRIGLTMEDVQGTANFNRLADTVLLLDSHEKKNSKLVGADPLSAPIPVWHTRTLMVGKARNGPGGNSRIAFEFSGPNLLELGVLAPRQRKEQGE